VIFQDDGLVAVETAAEVMAPPKKYEYTLDDFFGSEPFDTLYRYIGAPFIFQQEVSKMAINATEVGFRGFKSTLKVYLDARKEDQRCYKIQKAQDPPFSHSQRKALQGIPHHVQSRHRSLSYTYSASCFQIGSNNISIISQTGRDVNLTIKTNRSCFATNIPCIERNAL
jgi:hypothetical protein